MSDFIRRRKVQINFYDHKRENIFLLAEIALVSQLLDGLTEVTICKEYYPDLFAIRKLKEFLISGKESLNVAKAVINENNKFF